MGKRGDAIVAACLIVAFLIVVMSVAVSFVGDPARAAHASSLACFCLLFAIYLEVYARRG